MTKSKKKRLRGWEAQKECDDRLGGKGTLRKVFYFLVFVLWLEGAAQIVDTGKGTGVFLVLGTRWLAL